MKIKLLIGTSLLSLLLLCSCSSKEAKDPEKNDEVQYPENGVYYEYSSGGNSDRVVRSLTFENGKEISRNEYDYWDNGKLREIKTMVGETVTDTWSYNYSTDGLLSQMVRQYTEDGEKCRDDYRYDEKGNVTLISLYTDDAYIGGERFTYTKNGDALAKAPAEAGDYVAEIKVDDVKTEDPANTSVTASVGYTIDKADPVYEIKKDHTGEV